MMRRLFMLSGIVVVVGLMVSATLRAEAEAPRLELSIREPGFHFASGEQVIKTVVVRSSDPARPLTNVHVIWQFGVGVAAVQMGSFEANGTGEYTREITLTIPEVKRVIPGVLVLAAVQDGPYLARAHYGLLVLPPQPPVPAVLSDKEILLVDPSGETAAALDSLGVDYVKKPRPQRGASTLPDLIILGTGIPSRDLARFLAELKDVVSTGTVVLCMAQETFEAKQFPSVVLQDAGPTCCVWSEPAGEHIVSGDLSWCALGQWRPDGRSIAATIKTPATGNFRILLDVTAAEDATTEAAVIEFPFGKGRFIFSQLLIGERFFDEPVAPYAFVNLLVHGVVSENPVPARVALIAGPDDLQLPGSLELLGIEPALKPQSLSGYDLVLVSGDETSGEHFAREGNRVGEQISTVVDSGGTVLMLNLHPRAVEVLDAAFPGRMTVTPSDAPAELDFSKIRDNLLFQGIRLPELRSLCQRAEFPIIVLEQEGAQTPVRVPGILLTERGKGRLIISQLPLPADESDEESLRTYSQLLTNLGVDLNPQ